MQDICASRIPNARPYTDRASFREICLGKASDPRQARVACMAAVTLPEYRKPSEAQSKTSVLTTVGVLDISRNRKHRYKFVYKIFNFTDMEHQHQHTHRVPQRQMADFTAVVLMLTEPGPSMNATSLPPQSLWLGKGRSYQTRFTKDPCDTHENMAQDFLLSTSNLIISASCSTLSAA